MSSFDASRSVVIAADSWGSLRRSDVYRVFDSHEPEHWAAIAKVMATERPEFAEEINEVVTELESELYSTGGDK